LRNFFRHDYHYHTVYGLMRRDILAQTGLHGDWYGSDRALLIELSLYGCFRIVPDVLLSLREHPGRSSHVADKVAWFTPQLAGRSAPEYWKRILNAVRMVLSSPMGWDDRARCFAEVAQRGCERYEHWLPRLGAELVHSAARPFRLRNAVHQIK
jgi:hypothetical protein